MEKTTRQPVLSPEELRERQARALVADLSGELRWGVVFTRIVQDASDEERATNRELLRRARDRRAELEAERQARLRGEDIESFNATNRPA